jgi:hypothetical protein
MCADDEFFDVVVRMCSKCSDVCNTSVDSKRFCLDNCPAYYNVWFSTGSTPLSSSYDITSLATSRTRVLSTFQVLVRKPLFWTSVTCLFVSFVALTVLAVVCCRVPASRGGRGRLTARHRLQRLRRGFDAKLKSATDAAAHSDKNSHPKSDDGSGYGGVGRKSECVGSFVIRDDMRCNSPCSLHLSSSALYGLLEPLEAVSVLRQLAPSRSTNPDSSSLSLHLYPPPVKSDVTRRAESSEGRRRPGGSTQSRDASPSAINVGQASAVIDINCVGNHTSDYWQKVASVSSSVRELASRDVIVGFSDSDCYCRQAVQVADDDDNDDVTNPAESVCRSASDITESSGCYSAVTSLVSFAGDVTFQSVAVDENWQQAFYQYGRKQTLLEFSDSGCDDVSSSSSGNSSIVDTKLHQVEYLSTGDETELKGTQGWCRRLEISNIDGLCVESLQLEKFYGY